MNRWVSSLPFYFMYLVEPTNLFGLKQKMVFLMLKMHTIYIKPSLLKMKVNSLIVETMIISKGTYRKLKRQMSPKYYFGDPARIFSSLIKIFRKRKLSQVISVLSVIYILKLYVMRFGSLRGQEMFVAKVVEWSKKLPSPVPHSRKYGFTFHASSLSMN